MCAIERTANQLCSLCVMIAKRFCRIISGLCCDDCSVHETASSVFIFCVRVRACACMCVHPCISLSISVFQDGKMCADFAFDERVRQLLQVNR